MKARRSFWQTLAAALAAALLIYLISAASRPLSALSLVTSLYVPVMVRQPTPTPTVTSTPTATPPPTATPISSGLLPNGNFEQADGGTGTGVANWLPWWYEIPDPMDGSFNYAFKPNSFNQECLYLGAASEFVYNGSCSHRILNNWNPWHAGVKQVVAVPPGAHVRLTAYGRLWASNVDYPAPSQTWVAATMHVGIEPNGIIGGQTPPGTVTWSGTITPHTAWQSVSVETFAGGGGTVAVFLGTNYIGYSQLYLTSFWDAAVLEGVP